MPEIARDNVIPFPIGEAERILIWSDNLDGLRELLVEETSGRRILGDWPLELNEMTSAAELCGKSLGPRDLRAVQCQIEHHYALRTSDGKKKTLKLSQERVYEAVMAAAEMKPYHPVREYLSGLAAPSGDSVMSQYLERGLKVPATPLYQAFINCFFISAVARVLYRGECQVDTMLVLVGRQGLLKSSSFRILGGEWFSDSHFDINDSKRWPLLLARTWIYEFPELEEMLRKHAQEGFKRFISSTKDDFIGMYSRVVQTNRRSVVLVGTTNSHELLTDPTGNRRFHIIPIEQEADRGWISTNRNALWAEAVARFRAGEKWHLSPAMEAARADREAEFMPQDSWTDIVLCEAAYPGVHQLTTAYLLEKAIEKPRGHWTRTDEMRIAAIMKRSGWSQARPRLEDGTRPRVWVRETVPTGPVEDNEVGPENK